MKKPEVIILHGWSISSENEAKWQSFRDMLLERGVTSQFLSIPGLDEPLESPWTLKEYGTWLETRLSSVSRKDRQVILLGHSFGGQLAVRFAAEHPSLVSKLILIAPAGIRDYSLLARSKRVFWGFLAQMGKQIPTNPAVKRVAYRLIGEHDYESAPQVMKQTMSAVLSEEIRDDLAKISCPVFLVWGKEDSSAPFKNLALFRAAIPRLTVSVVDTARHSPQFTHTAAVATAVAGWLDTEQSS